MNAGYLMMVPQVPADFFCSHEDDLVTTACARIFSVKADTTVCCPSTSGAINCTSSVPPLFPPPLMANSGMVTMVRLGKFVLICVYTLTLYWFVLLKF